MAGPRPGDVSYRVAAFNGLDWISDTGVLAPAFSSAVANGTSLVITMDETLAAALSPTDGGVKVSYTKPDTGSDNKLADAAGNEAASFTDQAVTNDTAAVPGAPGNLTATPGDTRVSLSWTAAAANNSAITKYQYRYKAGDGSFGNWTDVPDSDDSGTDLDDETGATVTSLTNDTAYTFEVRAVNGVGDGAAASVAATPAAADTTPPTVTSIARQTPSSSPTNADSLTWRVTFSENVKNVNAADFEAAGTTATLAVSEVTASTVYDVTASAGDLAGLDATVTLSFASGQDVKDTADNALDSTAPTGTNDATYAVDNTAPGFTSAAADGTSLVITMNETLAAAASLADGAFGVKKTPSGGAEETVSLSTTTAPVIDGATVTLTLATALSPTDTGVKVSYTKPDTGSDNKLADAAGNETASFTDQPAANNTTAAAPATGKPTISGTAAIGQTLTAAIGTVADVNGLPDAADLSWQWQRVDGGIVSDIPNATGTTYTVPTNDAGFKLRVWVKFSDNLGTPEARASDATTTVPVGTLAGCAVPTLTNRTVVLQTRSRLGPGTDTVTTPGYGFFVLYRGNAGRSGARSFTTANGSYTVQALHYWTGIDGTNEGQLVGSDYKNKDLMLTLNRLLHATDKSNLKLHICDTEYALSATREVVEYTDDEKDYLWSNVDLSYTTETEQIVTLSVPTMTRSRATGPTAGETAVSGPPGGNGAWDPGERVEATITFSQAVNVGTAKGTPSVKLEIGTDATQKAAAYLKGSGTATLTFGYTLASDEGRHSSARLVANSLALNGGTIRSAVNGADAALAHNGAAWVGEAIRSEPPSGPTARFSNAPARHDGASTFEIGLVFSGESNITSYVTVRDALLEATGASIVQARRKTQGSNAAWILTVQPSGVGDVALTLPARACSEANAVCIDGQPLTAPATVSVEGPPFTASFDGAPAEHDGSAFTVTFRISAEPDGLSYATVRDALFTATGATVTGARRLTPGSDRNWELTVRPSGFGAVTLALVATTDCDGTPGVCDAADRMLAGPLSLTVEGPPTLSVADAEVQEAADATLAFTVTLSRSLTEAVTVAYATSDGTATAGSDYTAADGTLTFAAGDTQKTVAVAVLDDTHDEGSETLTLTLSNPSPARVKLADATATGTIRNTDLMPAAWTARFGRTVAEQVLETVDNRMQAARTPGVEVTVAGERLDGQTHAAGTSGAAVSAHPGVGETAAGQPVALTDGLRDATDPNAEATHSRTISNRDLLLGSTFLLTAADGAPGTGGATYSLWGRSAVSNFDGRDGDLTVNGEVVSAMLGADWSRGHMLAGLIVGHSSGDGGYRAPSGGGAVSSTLTGLYPWGRYALSERLDVWAAAGYGEGRLTLTPDGQDAIRTDLDLWMGAIGLHGALVDGGASGLSLTSKTDALLVETSTAAVAGLAATASSVTRLRLAVEGTLPVRLSNGWVVTPAVELGLRHDGGDAETGFGLDVGAGLVWRAERLGLSAEIRGRGLVTHEASGFRDVGLSGSLAWRPAVDERGPSLSLAQTYGGSSSGGVGALLERGTLSGLSATGAGEELGALHRQRLEARFGYGVPVFGDSFTWIPEVGVGVSETGRDYRLGWRLVRVERGSVSAMGRLELSLEAMRRESAVDGAAKPEHSVGMRLTAPF